MRERGHTQCHCRRVICKCQSPACQGKSERERGSGRVRRGEERREERREEGEVYIEGGRENMRVLAGCRRREGRKVRGDRKRNWRQRGEVTFCFNIKDLV